MIGLALTFVPKGRFENSPAIYRWEPRALDSYGAKANAR